MQASNKFLPLAVVLRYEEYIPQSHFESPENVHQERDYDAVAVTADT